MNWKMIIFLLGTAIETAVPNTESLFRVDFTILDVILPPVS